MDAIDAILSRRSRKHFVDRPVPFEIIAEIVNAGNHAPSAGNLQNWRFLVVTDHKKIEKLPLLCNNQEYAHSAFSIIVCSEVTLCEEYFGEKERTYSTQNCAAAIQNMLIAANNFGLGAVWLGAFDEKRIKEEFEIEEGFRIEAVISMGYSNEIPKAKNMKDLRAVTFFNQWNNRVKTVDVKERDFNTINEFIVNQSKSTWEKGKHAMKKYLQKKRD